MYFNFAIIDFFLICEKSIIKCSFEVLRNVEFLLTAIKVKEVTAKKTEFLALHDDFVRNLASRHNRTASKMVWHFLSGAAVYIPKFDINFLFERVFYSFDNGKGHHTSVEKSFLIYTPWDRE
jgi:hypothetical protein